MHMFCPGWRFISSVFLVLALTSIEVYGASLKLEAEKLHAACEGKNSSNVQTDLASPRRPQEPRKPYPYREEDVSYKNQAQGNTLAATLTIPAGKGPFPAVVLITGSGPQDRDESLMGHKPFLVLSDYLTRKGIVVLRADDRGVGKSTGEFSGATTADFATDTEAGIAYLKTRPEVNPKLIGLVGHSEGGVIAPMIAARRSAVAFIVMLAGPGVPGDEIIVKQAELLAQSVGKSRQEAAKAAEKQRKILNIVKEDVDPDSLDKQLHEELSGELSGAQISAILRQMNIRWLRYFLTYDPALALGKVTCPVLALNGSKDLQVPPDQNLPPIRKALAVGGNKNFEVDELPGLNHLFQTAKTGAPAEYSEIEETISPMVLEKIAAWILKVASSVP